MLQGTFETLSLPEVLGLLASARKRGALWLDAGPVSGVVHLEDGHCRATEAGDQRGPVEDGSALLVRLVDVCFAVMRQDSGSFRFAADEPAPWSCPEPVELSDALVEVERLVKQWREILRVIPSLECRPRLLDALEVDELVVDRERWALLVAIDGRRTVRELVARMNRPVLELCHDLLELVESGAIGVIDPAATRLPEPAPTEPVAEPADEAARERFAPAPEAETDGDAEVPGARVAEMAEARPAPEPTPEPAPERELESEGAPGAEPPDKGAFLRLFSGLRES